ncbi:hypothetical protein BS47DRAFT_1464719 [Hydnum rufescens UP504]|uniref:Uncharacterized protein n=1 Tax=Hydnum rufescens UP504 TaxID=1448309 RepID=A0A9P6DYL3_9AGAM|nr:hypothetical protein BS47DRAFT_1464719 [Hydnum rufescens UP504]
MLRTAQASQLRRRGALRGDRRSSVSRDRAGEDPPPDEVTQRNLSLQERTLGHRIRCGRTDAPPSNEDQINKPFVPFPLPVLPNSLKRKYSDCFAFSSPSQQPSNGCGELLDVAAQPNSELRAWVASVPRAVATLEDIYFEALPYAETSPRKPGSMPCGCIRRAFGCVVCGNVLGTSIQLCSSHQERISSSSRERRDNNVIHLFLPSRVTPSPEYSFSPRSELPMHAGPESQSASTSDSYRSPSYPITLEGRTVIRRRLLPVATATENVAHTDFHTAVRERERERMAEVRSRLGNRVSSDWSPVSSPRDLSQRPSASFPEFPPLSMIDLTATLDLSQEPRVRTLEGFTTRRAEREGLLQRMRTLRSSSDDLQDQARARELARLALSARGARSVEPDPGWDITWWSRPASDPLLDESLSSVSRHPDPDVSSSTALLASQTLPVLIGDGTTRDTECDAEVA